MAATGNSTNALRHLLRAREKYTNMPSMERPVLGVARYAEHAKNTLFSEDEIADIEAAGIDITAKEWTDFITKKAPNPFSICIENQ